MATQDDKINCAECGAAVHVIKGHLEKAHPGMTLEQYQDKHPLEEVLSPYAKQIVAEKAAQKAAAEAAAAGTTVAAGAATSVAETPAANAAALVPASGIIRKPLHEVFELGAIADAMNAKGDPIPITTLAAHDQQDMVPEVSGDYVYIPSEVKDVILALETKIPCYVWGHKGSGKSELFE